MTDLREIYARHRDAAESYRTRAGYAEDPDGEYSIDELESLADFHDAEAERIRRKINDQTDPDP